MSAAPPPSILLVEDDFTFRHIVERNLQVRGIDERGVASVSEALIAIAQRQPDLMLLDINLPDQTGWDLLRILRGRGVEIPTVIISAGRVAPERLAEFEPLGFVPKPFSIDAVLRIVRGMPISEAANG